MKNYSLYYVLIAAHSHFILTESFWRFEMKFTKKTAWLI